MNLRTFLLIDTVALDAAGVVALVLGETAIGVVLLALAGVTFLAFVARHRGTRLAA